MALIDRLKRRRDKIQQQLDRWIDRGFRGGGTIPSEDATAKGTAKKVSEVADLKLSSRSGRLGITMPKGPKGEKRPVDVVSNAVKVTRIATGEETDTLTETRIPSS
jgi:hypothetical protein